jgi:hypothetical protein
VSGRVGDDEGPLGSREVAVGDIDRDSLLALRAKAVGEQREVDLTVGAMSPLAGFRDRVQLVLEDRFRVVEQTADQRRLAVVDRSRGGETQQLSPASGVS